MDKFILKSDQENVNPIHPKGLGWRIFECMKANGDLVMQICGESGVQESFKDVLRRSIRTALEMKKRGITSNDLIIICSYNHFNTCVPFLASLFLNCKVACLDSRLSISDAQHLMKQVQTKMMFIDKESENFISNVLEENDREIEIISFSNNSVYESFINFLQYHPDENQFEPVFADNLKDTILIYFSSGTTGTPKCICLHHYGIMKLLHAKKKEVNPPVLVFNTSLYWISAFRIMFIQIQEGSSKIVINKFEAKGAAQVINAFKPHGIIGVPFQLMQLLNCIDKTDTNVKYIVTAGTAISERQINSIKLKFSNAILFNLYGLTEACGSLLEPDVTTKRPKSCGTVLPGILYKVVDIDTGKLCGPYQQGELCVKSDLIFAGYLNNNSLAARNEDEWYNTGDVMYYDEDKYFYLVDRTKDLIKYQGLQVVPAKLEKIILRHPDVEECAVFGIPFEVDGEHPLAAVILKKGAIVTSEELIKFADEQLEDCEKLRGGVKIFKKFPYTASGKINRRELKQLIKNIS